MAFLYCMYVFSKLLFQNHHQENGSVTWRDVHYNVHEYQCDVYKGQGKYITLHNWSQFLNSDLLACCDLRNQTRLDCPSCMFFFSLFAMESPSICDAGFGYCCYCYYCFIRGFDFIVYISR